MFSVDWSWIEVVVSQVSFVVSKQEMDFVDFHRNSAAPATENCLGSSHDKNDWMISVEKSAFSSKRMGPNFEWLLFDREDFLAIPLLSTRCNCWLSWQMFEHLYQWDRKKGNRKRLRWNERVLVRKSIIVFQTCSRIGLNQLPSWDKFLFIFIRFQEFDLNFFNWNESN